MERKTDTMKSYILRSTQTVESQITGIPTGAKPPVIFIGLDVHNDSIAVSITPADVTEVRRYGIIGGEHDDMLKLVKKLQAGPSGSDLAIVLRSRAAGFCPVPVPAVARTGLYFGMSLQGAAQAGRAGQNRSAGCRPTGAAVPGRRVDGQLNPPPLSSSSG
jgi:hypothetical protein